MLFGVQNSTNQQYLFDFKIWTDIRIQAKLDTLSSFAKEKYFWCSGRKCMATRENNH